MAIGNDLTGGIDKISAGSYSHNKEDDNCELKKLFAEYATNAKD